MKYIIFILGTTTLLSVFQGCASDETPITCTSEFRIVELLVLEPDGSDADSVDITVIRENTGDTLKICEGFDVCSDTGNPDGEYVIMHDGYYEVLSPNGEFIKITGQKNNLGFNEDFIFAGGPCHISKIRGPESVTLAGS